MYRGHHAQKMQSSVFTLPWNRTNLFSIYRERRMMVIPSMYINLVEFIYIATVVPNPNPDNIMCN